MNIPLPPRRRTVAEDMLPLINIVFLLILFFLMAGHLAPGLRPEAGRAAVAVTGGAAEARGGGVIEIDRNGRARWQGALLDDAQLAAQAIDWARRHPQGGIGVEADARAPADHVVQVFSMLQGAGVREVRLLARAGR